MCGNLVGTFLVSATRTAIVSASGCLCGLKRLGGCACERSEGETCVDRVEDRVLVCGHIVFLWHTWYRVVSIMAVC